MLYSGDSARFSIGYSKGGKFQGELSSVLYEQADSTWLGEGWVAQSSGGLKLSYHRLQGATVHKYFLAHDQNQTRDRKVTLGYGREESDWFGNLNLSRATTGRRLMGTTSSTTTLQEAGVADGRSYIDTITRTLNTRFYEKAYDYGVGVRAGRTFDNRQVRITAGYDYEWGRSNAHQHTVSLMAEKAFAGTPHSVALQVDRVFKSGDLDTTRNETRAMVVYRYALGGNNSQPERLFRVTPVTTPAAMHSAEPAVAQNQAPLEPVKQWVKTKANMTAEAFFAFNSSRLTPSAKAELDRVAQQLKTQGHEGNVLIIGHTCDLGSDAANDKLSLQRATAVRDYLVAAGAFGATESLAEGRGKRDPKYPAEPATREKNRRVELEFYSFVDEEQVVAPAPAPASTATAAVTPQPPAVTYERELVEQPPAWVRQALRTPALHKRTVDVYRTKEETQTESRTRTWVNRAPTANDDAYQVAQGTSTSLSVLANDTDPDEGDQLTLVSVGQPAQGRVRLEGAQIVYAAPANFVGTDRFTYSIRDRQGMTSTAQVSVTVTGNTTANRAPVANDDAYQVTAGSTLSMAVLANDTDPDAGDVLAIASVGQPLKGSVRIDGQQISYTAPANFNGTDQFTYTAKDLQGLTASARVIVTVTGGSSPNRPPIANGDSFWVSGREPVLLSVLSNDSDPDGDTLSIVSVSPLVKNTGTLKIEGTQVLYTPKGPFFNDSFTYTISDGKGGQATASVQLIDP